MSYVIHVWEQPVPASLEEADRILQRLLAEQKPGEHPKLQAFVKVTWERYPSDPNTEPGDPVWPDDSLAQGYNGLPLVTLGIVTSHLDEVVPFIVQTAGNLGLVVYDPQYGTVYLPDGGVLGVRPPQRPASTPKPLQWQDVKKVLMTLLAPFFKSQGFESRSVKAEDFDGFVGSFDGGRHVIQLGTRESPSGIRIFILMRSNLDFVDAAVNPIFPGRREPNVVVSSGFNHALKAIDPSSASRLLQYQGEDLLVRSREDIEPLIAEVQDFFEQQLLPLMRQCETAQGLWRMALTCAEAGERRPMTVSTYAAMVAARRVGDTRFEDWAADELARHRASLEQLKVNASAHRPGFIENREDSYRKLEEFIGYVRANVIPLVDS